MSAALYEWAAAFLRHVVEHLRKRIVVAKIGKLFVGLITPGDTLRCLRRTRSCIASGSPLPRRTRVTEKDA
jgi:hypothetical protein